MRVRWPWLSFLLVTLLTLTIWPAAGVQAQPAAGRDTVVIGMSQEPDYLNPLFSEMAAAVSVNWTIFTRDVQRDNTWKNFPQGVEYLPTLKDGTWKLDGDKMSLIWKVKARTWSDGKPVTCGDYVFSYSVARNVQVPTCSPVRLMPSGRLASPLTRPRSWTSRPAAGSRCCLSRG